MSDRQEVKQQRITANTKIHALQIKNNHRIYPSYLIDHIKALACGGKDAPSNMQ
jgi:hypothetical protein